MTRNDTIRLLSLAAIWGSSFMFMRLLAPVLGPFWTADLRVGIAGLALCAYFLVIRLDCEWRRLWKEYLITGMLNTGVPFILFSYAALHIPAAYSAIINATVPLWGAVFTAIWLNEKLTRSKLLGTTLGIIGVGIATGIGSTAIGGQTALALLACTGAAICYGLGGIYIKKFVKGAKPMAMAGASQLFAGLALLPLAIAMPVPGAPTLVTAAQVVTFSLLCSAVAYILYYRLMEDVGPTRTFTVTFLVPVFAMFWGVLLLAEPIHLHMVIGAGIVILGTMLVLGFKPLSLIKPRAA
ncbi:MAG: DMT family transporter [Alphaproteobacteria bacterium]|nr:DMT family transporter [Alphaproteobacteria bacterium]